MKKKIWVALLASIVIGALCSGMALAAERTKVVLWDYSGEQVEFWKNHEAEFEQANPDIDFEHVAYAQAQYDQSLILAMQSGSGPDIFQLRPEVEPRDYIANGWIMPLDEYLDEEYLKRFDPRILVEGVTYFNGKLYGLIQIDRFLYMNGLMFYNKEVLRQAGLDPEKDIPTTFSEFRGACKKVTEAGNGEFFGLGLSGNPPSEVDRILSGLFTTATVASADTRYGWTGFDWRDGKYKGSDAEHQEVVQLLIDIAKDGSLVPGWNSLDKAGVRALFGENKIAFYFDGVWMPSVWADSGYPDIDFGVGLTPVPDGGRRAYRVMSAPKGIRVVNAATKDPEKTARVFQWINGPEIQQVFFEEFGQFGSIPSLDYSKADWFQQRQLEIGEIEVRVGPEVTFRNPDAAKVQKPNVTPGLAELTAAAIEKQDLNFYITEAQRWDELSQQELERNIKKALDEGANVSMEDFIFPDWDPMKDYAN